MTYDIIIIGAGLAGCSAAIQLADQGFRVLLLEQQQYPTHKLCGEFLSVEVISIFERLGVLDAVRQAGAVPIRHAYITTSTGASFRSQLPGVALGLSRYQLDWILFQRSRQLGARCLDGTVVQQVSGDFQQGFTVTTTQGNFAGRVVLAAYGKCSCLDRSLSRPFLQQKSPFVAFKAHYTGIDLPNVIELHAFPGGYCGLSAIESGQVNLCWIAHKRALKTDRDQQAPADLLNRGIPAVLRQNPVLGDRLQSMQRVPHSSHSLSQITFALKGTFDGDICMVGDTAGMIAPLCGDGMAMALHAAECVVPLVAAFLQQGLTASALKQAYATAWNREFKTRLRLGRFMHHRYINPGFATVGVTLCHLFPALGDWLIRQTRGNATASAQGGAKFPVSVET